MMRNTRKAEILFALGLIYGTAVLKAIEHVEPLYYIHIPWQAYTIIAVISAGAAIIVRIGMR